MNTQKAELKGTLDEFRADMAEFRADMAGFLSDMAQRDTRNTRWLIGVVVAAVAIIIAALRYFPAIPPAG